MKRTTIRAVMLLTLLLGLVVRGTRVVLPGVAMASSGQEANAPPMAYVGSFADLEYTVYAIDLSNGTKSAVLRQVFPGAADVKATLSPESGMIAFTVIPAEANPLWESSLWVGSIAGMTPQLLIAGVTAGLPVWSADGRRLTYVRLRGMEGTVYHYDTHAVDVSSGQTELLTTHDAMDVRLLTWSKEEQSLYFQEFLNGGDADIWALCSSTGQREVLVDGDLGNLPASVSLSPDGDRLAFARLHRETREPSASVSVLDLAGATVSTLAESQALLYDHLVWSTDGQSLWFSGQHSEGEQLYMLSSEIATPRVRVAHGLDSAVPMASLPDGRLVVLRESVAGHELHLVGEKDQVVIESERLDWLGVVHPVGGWSRFTQQSVDTSPFIEPADLTPMSAPMAPSNPSASGQDVVDKAQSYVDAHQHYIMGGHGQIGTANPYHYVTPNVNNYCHTYPNHGLCTDKRHFDCLGMVWRAFYETGAGDLLFGGNEPWVVSTLLAYWQRNHPNRVHYDYNWSGRRPGDPVIVNSGGHIGILAAGDRFINSTGGFCSNPSGCSGDGVRNDRLVDWSGGFVAYLDIDWPASDDPNPPNTSITSGPSGLIGSSSATFSYTSSDDQTATGDLVYSRKLAGHSSDWSGWTGSTSASYSSLSDGSYTFYVKARDEAGNIDPSPADRSFTVDVSPPTPPNITIGGAGCDGIQNDAWQNTCCDPSFSFSASDKGSGVKGYHYYWGSLSNGTPVTWTTGNGFDPPAFSSPGSWGERYFNVRARDNLNHDSSVSTFAVLFDDVDPTASVEINNDADTTYQTGVLLNLSASDTGSGLEAMRTSNNGLTWSDWQSYADTIPWTLPALDRRMLSVYVQVRDKAGNEVSASDTITLSLYPAMPHSDNYRICADVVDVGGSVRVTSTSYSLNSAIGQPWATGATANTSSVFSERAGFLSSVTGCLPISFTVTSEFSVTQWVVASGGNLRGSTSYRVGDTAGQTAASGGNTFTSTSYVLSSGFWATISGTLPERPPDPPSYPPPDSTPTPTPSPTPTPQPGVFGVSINEGALYTNDPVVTVRTWAPDVTHLRLSNEEEDVGLDWQIYQVTTTWTISTSGDYATPRTVYAWFRDARSNLYGPYSDQIIYDPIAPTGAVWAMQQATMTYFLELPAHDDNSGVSDMRLEGSVERTMEAEWQSYQMTTTYALTSGQVVYGQFRDWAGNESYVYGSDGSTYIPNAKRIYLPLVLRNG